VPAGPLGHGVAIGAGMALGARLDRSPRKAYVVLGDGEINSGVIWEGALVAAKFRLDNLKVILDRNNVQQTGTADRVMPTEPLADKWTAFNWHVIEADGHSVADMLDALDRADRVQGRPAVIIARTVKGKGVSFMENESYWHGGIPTDDQFQTALAELQKGAEQWPA
jgi:transketolase